MGYNLGKWQRCLGLSRVLNATLVFRIDSQQTGIEIHLWLAREQLPAFETGNRDQQKTFGPFGIVCLFNDLEYLVGCLMAFAWVIK